jgi:nucleoside-diphosphate-sugar epimerase
MPTTPHLLIFGLGYCGAAVAGAAHGAGFAVTGTARQVTAGSSQHCAIIRFDAAAPAIAAATHLLSTVPPDATDSARAGTRPDPVLARYAGVIAAAPHLRWVGYLSSTVVYGDRAGGWADEDTPAAPSQERGQRRLDAETAWCALADGRSVDIFRLAGIYGPGRSAFESLRSGQARRIVSPGHKFGRIHRDDVAAAVLAAMWQARAPGRRVLNLADDTPAEAAAVIEEAARLCGVPPPSAVPFADAAPSMSPMARSFWAENRKVASRKTQAMLGLTWRYPSYREGLRAILRDEQGTDGSDQQCEILRAR